MKFNIHNESRRPSSPTEESDFDLPASSTSMRESVPATLLKRRITEILALLRQARLSLFDLVLEVLDEQQPEYSYY